jgi:methyl-accepting chemotaxis protein
MTEISRMVTRISTATDGIAAAVEEQGAVTQEISRSVTSAAEGTGAINQAAGHVRETAGLTAERAATVAEASRSLLARAEQLTEETHQFIARIRDADRRSEPRTEVMHPARLIAGAATLAGTLRDVSAGGAAVMLDASQLPPGASEVTLMVPGMPVEAAARIVGQTVNRVNIAFLDRGKGEAVERWFAAQPRLRQAA